IDDASAAVPLARQALALARQTGAPALIATALLALGAAVAGTDPEQARTCLRESRQLSDALGHHSATDLLWATAIAFILGDQAATLELGRRAIRGLQWAGRIRMALVLYMIAVALLTTRPDAAAIIQGAAEAYVVESPTFALLSPAPRHPWARSARGNCAPRARAWTGTRPPPTPSPRPPRPSANSGLRPSHESVLGVYDVADVA